MAKNNIFDDETSNIWTAISSENRFFLNYNFLKLMCEIVPLWRLHAT